MRTVAAALVTLAVAANAAHAQTWRTLEVSRQLRDSADHRVVVKYAAGRVDIRPTSEPVLYSMELRYDEDNGRPMHDYDAASHELRVGLSDQSVRLMHRHDNGEGEMRLSLSRAVPMRLDLELGATEGRLDLGGLSVRDLRLQVGASETRVDFTAPNPVAMRDLAVELGAASITMRHLANARTADMRVHGGVGGAELDFGGEWTQDVSLDLDVSLGKVTLVVPDEVGIRLDVNRFLSSVSGDDLQKRGNTWYSDNWERARYRLRVTAKSAFGGIEVLRR